MSNIVQTGSTYRVFDESVRVYTELPLATYKVNFNPFEGFTLRAINDLSAGDEKAYGTLSNRVRKIIDTYDRMDRSLGVLASGDKGMGKTMLLRKVAAEAQGSLGMPIVIVDTNYSGVADFIDTLGECVVVFDEFEKVFPKRIDEDFQAQFLGLFDGMSMVKRMYIVTINDIDQINGYLVNRPGRFHYHLRFTYPTPEEIREYLGDNDIGEDQIKKVISFSRHTSVNYDHLRSIAFELRDSNDFDDIIGDLNIKRIDRPSFNITVELKNGVVLKGRTKLADNDNSLWVSGGGSSYCVCLDLEMIKFEESGVVIPVEALSFRDDDYDLEDNDHVSINDVVSVSAEIHIPYRIDF